MSSMIPRALLVVLAALPLLACKNDSASAAPTPVTSSVPASLTAILLSPSAAPAASAVATAGTTVAVRVDGDGFTPSSATFKKGEHAQLVFTRTSDKTCAKEVVFPELAITKALPLNQAVAIDVPTADARTLTFQCGMGMYKSKVTINGS